MKKDVLQKIIESTVRGYIKKKTDFRKEDPSMEKYAEVASAIVFYDSEEWQHREGAGSESIAGMVFEESVLYNILNMHDIDGDMKYSADAFDEFSILMDSIGVYFEPINSCMGTFYQN